MSRPPGASARRARHRSWPRTPDPDAPEVTGDEAARLAGLHATLVERLGPDAFAHARDRATRLPRAEVVELGLTAITSTARASDP